MIEEEVEDLEELGEDEPEQENISVWKLIPAKIYCVSIGFWSIGYPTYPAQKYRKLQKPNVYRSIINR